MSERLNSVWYGEGEHVFLGIHGWGGGHGTYEPIVEYIPETVRVLSVDLPGYGESPALERWDPDVVAARLLATLEAEGVDKATLLGNCSGAAFGLMAAQLLPHRFDRLVLIDPFAYFPWYFRLMVMPVLGPVAYWSSFGNPIGRWITNSGLSGHRTEESDLTESFEQLDHGVVYAYLRMLKSIGTYRRFEGLTMPIDIVYGENTFAAIRRSISMWKEVMPQAVATELVGAGHLPIEETPEQLATAAFLPHMADIVDLADVRARRAEMVS